MTLMGETRVRIRARRPARMLAALACLAAGALATWATTARADEPGYNLDIGALGSGDVPTANSPLLLDQLYTETERGLGVRANILPEGAIEAGPVVRVQPIEGVGGFEAPAATADEDWDVGGFVGYRFDGVDGANSSLGINLQLLGDPLSSDSSWAMTPGIDYSTPLDDSWQLDARLFSSYGREGGGIGGPSVPANGAPGLQSEQEPGFQDFGFSLGLGYSMADQWSVSTSAGYARARQPGPEKSAREDPEWTGEFFGGVMLNYRF